MSKEMDELRRRFFPPEGRGVNLVFQAVVKEIDEKHFTCTVTKDKEIDYFDVRLRALVNEKLTGLACIPKLKSTVLVCRIGGSNEVFVCQFSEIDKIVYTAGEDKKISFLTDLDKMKLKWGEKVSITLDEQAILLKNNNSAVSIKEDSIIMNEGELGGLVKIETLKSNLDNLKNFIEAMNTSIPIAITAIGDGTLAKGKIATGEYTKGMLGQTIQFQDMENTNILQ